MTDIMKFNDSVIMTIPGIGYINGGMILGEHNVVKNNATFKAYYDAMKAGRITMFLGTVPANLSESSGRCLLTK